METKENYIEFEKEISDRGIEHLIHFTPTINLLNIFKQGKLLSRTLLEEKLANGTLSSVNFLDGIRLDNKSYINLSLTSPNHFLFTKKRIQNESYTWCMLKIHPKYIYQFDTLFSVTNAANSHNRRNVCVTGDINKFRMMFEDSLQIITFQNSKIIPRNGLNPKYTTDYQAEVLVKNEILLSDILYMCFENEADLTVGKAALSDYDTSNFIVDVTLFTNSRI